jgi:shikimate dehydrogenase
MKLKERQFGLLGKSLKHSFSPKYFAAKFEREGIENADYKAFELPTIADFIQLRKDYPNLAGLNVTIPYKEEIIPYLDELSPEAKAIGAVNTIQFKSGKLIGHNTDIIGFQQSLLVLLEGSSPKQALILGTGGAAKAVAYSLQKLSISYHYVSRKAEDGQLSYEDLDQERIRNYQLIINTTPLGMYPKVDTAPQLSYEGISSGHYCYDLVYNPEETLFLKQAKAQAAKCCNGLAMLHAQAEAAWEIWNKKDQET